MREHSTTAGRRLVAILLAASLLAALASRVLAADVACPVGTRVRIGGTTGEVVQLGSESPHTGWARIATAASQPGEWVDWHRIEVRSITGALCAALEDRFAVSFGPHGVDDDDPPAQASPTPPGG